MTKAVPTFVFGGKTGLQGAQPPVAFIEIVARLSLHAAPIARAAQVSTRRLAVNNGRR